MKIRLKLVKVLLVFVMTCTVIAMPLGLVGSPRTGEYYQDTKSRYVSPLSTSCLQMGQIPVIGWLVFLPIGCVGCGVEIVAVNPLRDTLMLPVDMFKPYHGYYVRVIDEIGAPVPKAEVEIDGIGNSMLFWSDVKDKGTTDENGMVYIPRLNYLPSSLNVSAEGFHLRRGSIFIVHGADRDARPDRAKGPSWSTDGEGRRVYTVRMFRRRRPTAQQLLRVDACLWSPYGPRNAWTNGFDVVRRAWTPPRGNGVHADLVFSNELLPGEGGEAKHRLSVSVASEESGLMALPMLGESDSGKFCTDYEVPDVGDFKKSLDVGQLKKSSYESPEPADYIAYKVFRPDGGGKMYHGAFIQERWKGTFYLVANLVPGDRSLEPCKEEHDFNHKPER